MQGSYSKVVSIEECEPEDVYCISVPETGCFVANGMVIKNCDALRYAVCTAFPTGEFAHPDENLSYDQYRRKVFESESGWSDMLHAPMGI